MAIVNTGAVERTITGVNTSELFLDESSSTVNNTGAVERAISGVNDSQLFEQESTSTVNNTGAVERGITAVNTSEAFNNASRTNLIPFSEDFTEWTTGSTVTVSNGLSSPDGENNAYKLTKTGTSQPYVFETLGLSTTTKRSIFARTVSGTGTVNLLSHNSNTNNLFTVTEDWQRFEVDSSNAAGVSNFYAVDFRGSSTLTEVIVFGADATNSEAFIPTYIKTNGGPATVDSDSTSIVTNTGAVERTITGVN